MYVHNLYDDTIYIYIYIYIHVCTIIIDNIYNMIKDVLCDQYNYVIQSIVKIILLIIL